MARLKSTRSLWIIVALMLSACSGGGTTEPVEVGRNARTPAVVLLASSAISRIWRAVKTATPAGVRQFLWDAI